MPKKKLINILHRMENIWYYKFSDNQRYWMAIAVALIIVLIVYVPFIMFLLYFKSTFIGE